MDREQTSEKDFMGVGRGERASSYDAASAAHVNKSHAATYEAARYNMRMNNHIYIADPHIRSSQNDTHALAMIDSAPNIVDINGAARHSDWSGPTGRQLLYFHNLQEQRVAKSRLKMLPFLAPAASFLHEPGLTANVPHTLRVGGLYSHGQAHTPSFPSSSRVLSFDSRTKSSSAQLTIFYGGQVNVYNNVSSTKFKDIMHMAATGGTLSTQYTDLSLEKCAPMTSPQSRELLHIDLNTCEPYQVEANEVGVDLTPPQRDQSDNFPPRFNSTCVEEQPFVPRALPQARKASLARFLERRKQRLMTRSPYSMERSFTWESCH